MAHIVADRVKETTTTTGTGNVTLAGAASGYQAFSAVCANSDTFFYCIEGGSEWEVGYGTYVSATPAVSRTTIIASSNAGAAVNFSAGTKNVFLTSPAQMAQHGTLVVTPSSNQNDYNPAGLALCGVLELNIGASMKLTGLTGGVSGRRIILINTSSDYLLWLENENTSSSAANRFKLPKGFPAFLLPGDVIELIYSAAASRWCVASWPNQGPAMGLTEFSDWGNQAPSSSGQSMGPWTGLFSGSGAAFSTSGTYGVTDTERAVGQMQMSTGTTATGRIFVGQSSDASIIAAAGPRLALSRLAIQTAVDGTNTYTVRVGFSDEYAGTLNDAICWEYRWNGSSAEWSQTVVAATAATRSTTGSPTPDTTYIWLVVFVNANCTRADFIYSNDSVAFTKASSVSSGLPTNPTGFAAAAVLKSAGTTARLINVDLSGLRVDSVRA